jgi:hypothetical protein
MSGAEDHSRDQNAIREMEHAAQGQEEPSPGAASLSREIL